jgi:curved DNA-binding protein CbpA
VSSYTTKSAAGSYVTTLDHYDILQISPSADPETIHRVYRLLAQRFHPDNAETGNAERFRATIEAYEILSDPERRAQYDAVHRKLWRERWKLAEDASGDQNFQLEQVTRLTVLELLYARRRTQPYRPSVSFLDIEELTGRPREHLEFPVWFLTSKGFVNRGDDGALTITAEGVEYLEDHVTTGGKMRLLRASNG